MTEAGLAEVRSANESNLLSHPPESPKGLNRSLTTKTNCTMIALVPPAPKLRGPQTTRDPAAAIVGARTHPLNVVGTEGAFFLQGGRN